MQPGHSSNALSSFNSALIRKLNFCIVGTCVIICWLMSEISVSSNPKLNKIKASKYSLISGGAIIYCTENCGALRWDLHLRIRQQLLTISLQRGGMQRLKMSYRYKRMTYRQHNEPWNNQLSYNLYFNLCHHMVTDK